MQVLGNRHLVHPVLAWLKALLNPPETALKALENDDITAEALLRELDRVRADMSQLRFEWGETLDKMAKVAGRFSARERMRAKRSLDALTDDDDELEEVPRPRLVETQPPAAAAATGPYPFNPRDKASIRAYYAQQRSS